MMTVAIPGLSGWTDATVGTDFAERLLGSIQERAHGRVHDLQVEWAEGRIVLSGRCASLHAKQLALAAALELTDGLAPITTERIVVGAR